MPERCPERGPYGDTKNGPDQIRQDTEKIPQRYGDSHGKPTAGLDLVFDIKKKPRPHETQKKRCSEDAGSSNRKRYRNDRETHWRVIRDEINKAQKDGGRQNDKKKEEKLLQIVERRAQKTTTMKSNSIN